MPRCQNDFVSAIYIECHGAHDALPCGETSMPPASQPQNQIKLMGDKSPKSNQKKTTQKQSKATTASKSKSAAIAAKSAAGKKK